MRLGVTLDILNQKDTPAFYADTLANRPAAGFTGRVFISTDTYDLYRDTGTAWDLLSPSAASGITGSGAAGQIALWDGVSSITGDSGLTYDGATNSLTADKFIVSGGTSSQFLKGDGSLDNNTYLTSSSLSGYVPYTGATTNVDLGSFDLTADLITGATGSFTSSGGSNTFGITHTSGSGVALNISKDGNGEGLFITKGSGSGNAATINGGKVTIENNSSDAQLQIVSSSAPSIRIDDASFGASRRIGVGISTGINNFIQGSVDFDMCIFNSSTTPSPILFGIFNGINTQEAARISNNRNFLVNQTFDSGENLQVGGNARINGNITATSFITSTGIDTEILAADGSVITAGTNITISGGTISASGGGGGGGNIAEPNFATAQIINAATSPTIYDLTLLFPSINFSSATIHLDMQILIKGTSSVSSVYYNLLRDEFSPFFYYSSPYTQYDTGSPLFVSFIFSGTISNPTLEFYISAGDQVSVAFTITTL